MAKRKTAENVRNIVKKLAATALSAAILLANPGLSVNAAAIGSVISSTSESQTVTSGVIHKTIREFTTEGWLSIHILQVDLTNPNVKLEALTNPENATKLTGVLSLAESGKAVAAVNANYFYSVGTGIANALGPVISDRKIVSMSDGFNSAAETMATFSLDKSGIPAINFWKTNITISSPATGAVNMVSNYNRMTGYYFKDIIILDRNFGPMSLGASEQYPDMVEMVVADGVVSEIRIGQPPVEIPENGYVAVSRDTDTDFLTANFQVGYPVSLEVKSNIDWKNINVAVSGSAVILKDGVVQTTYSFSDPSNTKRNPRTLIGSTKDGKTLYIVTVDGRQKASIGMTLAEAGKFMLELGAYNALNLDGGGSTTMVTRPLGSNSVSLNNVPSDGGMRGVTTALGIISTAPASALSGMVIESEDVNVFVNATRRLTVRGYDKNFNPVEIKPESVKWSVSGIKGSVTADGTGFIFTPKEVGEAVVTASVGNIKKSINISSLSSPVRLVLDTSSIKVPVGSSTPLGITGYNVNGYPALLNPKDVTYKIVGLKGKDTETAVIPGKIEEGSFIATEAGTAYIDVSVGNVHSYCSVSVQRVSVLDKDNFEADTNRSFTSYPAGIEGAVVLSQDYAHEGLTSGKLSYNFPDSTDTQAAYLTYPDKGIAVDEGYGILGVYAYIPETEDSGTEITGTGDPGTATSETAASGTQTPETATSGTETPGTGTETTVPVIENMIRAQVVDGDGKAHLITLSQSMDWRGWKYLEASIAGLKAPVYITKLYVARVAPGLSKGDIYFDKLTVKKTWYDPVEETAVPKNTQPEDKAMVPAGNYKAASNAFRFAVMGQLTEPVSEIEKSIIKNMTDKINKYIDTAAVVGKSTHAFTKNLKKNHVSTNKGFKTYTVKNSLFIQLDMHDGSMRTSDPKQWNELFKTLKNVKSQHVFIFLPFSPEEMSDKLEAKLLKDTFTEFRKTSKKNVWVFFGGKENRSYMERGVKYISSCGYSVKDLNEKNADNALYYLVNVKGNTVTYELKPMNK